MKDKLNLWTELGHRYLTPLSQRLEGNRCWLKDGRKRLSDWYMRERA